jgi:hypothetical protein
MLQRRELPLLSDRDLQRRSAAQATAAIMPTAPVQLVHGKSLWQQHGNTQHQHGVQHLAANLHGDVAGRARRRRAVNGRFHTCRLTTTSDELGPKTKVGARKAAEPLEATPASRAKT